jgi:hypothetical protein
MNKKDLEREQKFMRMTDVEKIKIIEQCDEVIEGLGGARPEDILCMLKMSDEERERKAQEYTMKNFPEYEEKYQKLLK